MIRHLINIKFGNLPDHNKPFEIINIAIYNLLTTDDFAECNKRIHIPGT